MADIDDQETPESIEPPKKKGGFKKFILMTFMIVLLVGGGVGGGLYASRSGLIGGSASAAEADQPQLVPKSEEKRAGGGGEGHGGEGGGARAAEGSKKTPAGHGGARYASNYFSMDKEFTSNLKDSVHFVQVGVAVSTPYDDRVIENLQTHEIAVRSAILMALGDATEEQVFTAEGKKDLQIHLVKAINGVLKEKEGFGGVGNVYFTNFVVQ